MMWYFKLLICSALAIELTFGSEGVHGNCKESDCSGSQCKCASTAPIRTNESEIPQLIMLTFDDAVTVLNYQTYSKLLFNRIQASNNCSAKATFFVSHEYTDYKLVHNLHRQGNEIGVHSISHKSETEAWKNAKTDYVRKEMYGMKQLIAKFAEIPLEDIIGARVPFLQTSGDFYFKALEMDNFTYDSSMPSRQINPPLYPYTLDAGFQHDCQIQPCPTANYSGLWLVPLVNNRRHGVKDSQGNIIDSYCAMADACIPLPETANETFEFLKMNFKRYYESNRAPMPIFIHEAWIKDEKRREGYFQFMDFVTKKEDVFLVTVKEAIRYMTDPQPVDQYRKRECPKIGPVKRCSRRGFEGTSCEFKNLPQFWGGSRFMKVCQDMCPRDYPWVDNPLGA